MVSGSQQERLWWIQRHTHEKMRLLWVSARSWICKASVNPKHTKMNLPVDPSHYFYISEESDKRQEKKQEARSMLQGVALQFCYLLYPQPRRSRIQWMKAQHTAPPFQHAHSLLQQSPAEAEDLFPKWDYHYNLKVLLRLSGSRQVRGLARILIDNFPPNRFQMDGRKHSLNLHYDSLPWLGHVQCTNYPGHGLQGNWPSMCHCIFVSITLSEFKGSMHPKQQYWLYDAL